MDLHTAQHQNAMRIGAGHLKQHATAISNDTAIRLANARKNAEAIARQRRYDQAMNSNQEDRNTKERMHAASLALKAMELNARNLLR